MMDQVRHLVSEIGHDGTWAGLSCLSNEEAFCWAFDEVIIRKPASGKAAQVRCRDVDAGAKVKFVVLWGQN